MPASNKVGTQLLVSRHLRDRARALAIVRRESVAEVYRAALERVFPELERAHAAELAVLYEAFSRLELDRSRALDDMIHKRLTHVRLSGVMGYPESGEWPAWFGQQGQDARAGSTQDEPIGQDDSADI